MPRSRSYVFTLNNYTEEEEEKTRDLGETCRYMVFGKEVGEQGTPHLQGYIVFPNARSLAGVKSLLPRAHFEVAKGNAEQNREYCSKQGDFFEFGEMPISQKRKGELERERWSKARRLAEEGDFENIDDQIYVTHYRTLKLIAKDHMPDVDDAEDVTGEWYWGPPGTGKSRTAREKYPGSYLKMCNKWWDGYQDEKTVIIDDFDKNHRVLGHHLKIWSDRYCFLCETKGGARKIRPEKIVVTSNYRIEDIFEDAALVGALKRRFKVTHFPESL